MMKLASWIPWTRKSFRQNLNERYENLAPHEQLLPLVCQMGGKAQQTQLRANHEVRRTVTLFVAILIDLGGIEYLLSSADLASIAAAIARSWWWLHAQSS
jgi:hypothetical protein